MRRPCVDSFGNCAVLCWSISYGVRGAEWVCRLHIFLTSPPTWPKLMLFPGPCLALQELGKCLDL